MPTVVDTGDEGQLVELVDVKDYVGIPQTDTSRDEKLDRYISAVTALIEQVTGPILPRVFEEWHDGGGTYLILRRRPSNGYGTTPIVRLLGCEEFRGTTRYALRVVADPALGTTYSVTADTTGLVTRRTAGGGVTAFAAGDSTVHVVYQAGQETVPANVYEGALEAIRVNYQTTEQVGRGRLTVSDEEEIGPPLSFFLPRRVIELLSPQRRAPSVA
jgi:hypothetical protein